jgi:hypothetical protein
MSDSDIAFAKKRLAGSLRILVLVQLAALGSLVAFGVANVVGFLENTEMNVVSAICNYLPTFAVFSFLLATLWGICKIMWIARRPVAVRIYLWGFLFYFGLLFVFIVFSEPNWFLQLFIWIFPFYCVLPQFFISRWLTKAAEAESYSATESTGIHG